MGTTYVGIGDNGFWVKDGILEIFLRFAALHIEEPSGDIDEQHVEKIHELRNKWLMASLGVFSGCVPNYIEEFSNNEIGRLAMLNSCKGVISALGNGDGIVSADFINLLGMRCLQVVDIEKWRLIEIGQAIVNLINGYKFGPPSAKDIPMPGCGTIPGYKIWK